MNRSVRILFVLALSGQLPTHALAADLVIDPADQNLITINVISDTQWPLVCVDSPCSTTFATIVDHLNTRVPDFTYHNGDLGFCSYGEPSISKFLEIYDNIEGVKAWGMGNHEADPGTDSSGAAVWFDAANHYAPANWLEPLFGCTEKTPLEDCRRWYSVYIGSPPRVAMLAVSNNSDSDLDDLLYIYCGTPNDFLHTAGSTQREWLENEIDNLPPTIEVVFVAGHRTYYGVENFIYRPNVVYSSFGENQRTSPTSFLRVLESIYDRKPNVKLVVVLNGDQHCFADVGRIRENARDDQRGVWYLTVGGSGARINRAEPFPALNKIPPGLLRFAFDENWFSTRFEITPDELDFSVFEAYTDSLLYTTSWPFSAAVDAPPVEPPVPADRLTLHSWPNPAASRVEIRFRVPVEMHSRKVDEIAIYDVAGRKVRDLAHGVYATGEFHRTWDLTDDSGKAVASGQYYTRVKMGNEVLTAPTTVKR